MFRSILMIGAGWFVYTKQGRKTFKNICLNCVPYVEKQMGINIMKPIQELTKDPMEEK